MSMISALVQHLPRWLDEDDHLKVNLATRIRLVRNVVGFCYPQRLQNDDRLEVRALILKAFEQVSGFADYNIFKLEELTETEKQILTERRLVPKNFIFGNLVGRAVLLSDDENLSICINAENHIRVQLQLSNNNLGKGISKVTEISDKISEHLDFVYDDEFGYLSARLKDTGIGLKLSSWLHIPILYLENQLGRVTRAIDQVNLGFNKDYQANDDELAGFYLIHSLQTLGINEKDLESQMQLIVNQTVDYEKKMRGLALVNRREYIEDRSWRAFGLLKTARIISGNETLKLLSDLRMAASMNILNEIDPKLILKLLFQTQTGHLMELKQNDVKDNGIQKVS